MSRKEFQEGAIASIPIMIGYFPVAMAYGLLAKNTGLVLGDTFLFSLLNYAGSSQFMCVNLIGTGAAFASIVLMTFLLNSRAMMMSASVAIHMEKVHQKALPVVGALLTDEAFSVLYFNRQKLTTSYVLGVQIPSYFSWVFGGVVGYLVGEVLPPDIQAAMGVGLTGMFVALVVPPIKHDHRGLRVAIVSMIVYALVHFFQIFGQGWDLVLSILVSSLLSLYFYREKVEN